MTLIKHAPIGLAFAASYLEILTPTLFSMAVFRDPVALWQAVGCCASGVIVLAPMEGRT
jgi:drug/metabolite transporter (DMT)-like permease